MEEPVDVRAEASEAGSFSSERSSPSSRGFNIYPPSFGAPSTSSSSSVASAFEISAVFILFGRRNPQSSAERSSTQSRTHDDERRRRDAETPSSRVHVDAAPVGRT